jgi:hypothetical protein
MHFSKQTKINYEWLQETQLCTLQEFSALKLLMYNNICHSKMLSIVEFCHHVSTYWWVAPMQTMIPFPNILAIIFPFTPYKSWSICSISYWSAFWCRNFKVWCWTTWPSYTRNKPVTWGGKSVDCWKQNVKSLMQANPYVVESTDTVFCEIWTGACSQ